MSIRNKQKINFNVGDLVIPNFDYLEIEPYDCLFLIVKIEYEKNDHHIWWRTPEEDTVYITVREVKTGREHTSLIILHEGKENCEWNLVE